MSAAELLGQARRLLNTRSVGGLSPRMAAFIARQALEDIVAQRCSALGVVSPAANMRSKLLVLRALDEPAVADAAAVAWSRLSNACHLHAYEMQPSLTEVEHLCGLVASLLPEGVNSGP
ncbi:MULTISPECIES: hypothetical protein [Mycobacterium]|uniref:Uncharacterized protein n=1 Tax=Mycobacterium kiyosense TaxID=2871094 RepID=A0A9P3QAQ0_9MYCO|nr:MULTISPECIES: hypothetical protein [Mycobacterium]BDB41921.1 hypothetical protein IWGMT90018_23670 [Mycobacterium kiyosense]BDE14792.1 hypothetical protein MKCMC460_36520 [Mycobacterium sp. 20KCMC460]GLB84218.1 hypothetical protein SRL2020028_34740 [Mycobacterium kiyosense]GLB91739.1 hypothetical protein SRL2020130_45560 [Mycobacterium kiyosense]GLB96744.1 hypothetical protein SRL2020226_35200 [Mycobacterium kiyosense]